MFFIVQSVRPQGPKLDSCWGSSHLSLSLLGLWGIIDLPNFLISAALHFPGQGAGSWELGPEPSVSHEPAVVSGVFSWTLRVSGVWLATPSLRAHGISSPIMLLVDLLGRLVGKCFGSFLLCCCFFSGSSRLSESSLLVVCDLTSPQSAELCAGMWFARWARELLLEEVRQGQSQGLTYKGTKSILFFLWVLR